MSLFGYPLLLTFLLLALALLLAGSFFRKLTLFFDCLGIAFFILYFINALLLGFPVMEVILTTTLAALLLLIPLMVKEKRG